MLNHYTAIGRLIKDPVLYETGSKQPFCPFRIAVDRDYKNSDGKYEADYINCTIWGSGAKIIAERFRKGSRICIEGRLQTRKYEKDGSTMILSRGLGTHTIHVRMFNPGEVSVIKLRGKKNVT